MFRFPRESGIRYLLDEPQEQQVFEPLAFQIFPYKGVGAQRSSQNVNLIDLRRGPYAFLVEGVREFTAVGDVAYR